MLLKIWNAIRLNIGILHLIVDVWKIRCLALSINDLCLGSFLWLCHDLILNVMLCSLPLRFEICSNCSGNTIVLLFSKENLVVSISLFLCFGSINVCTIFFFFYRKNHFIGRKKTQEMHLLLICHCVQSINVVAGLYYSHYLPQYMLSVL